MGEQIKKMKAKVIHKYETEANWNLSNYVPDVGETVFYDIDETHDYVRQKNGDGIHSVKDLPFASIQNIQDSAAKGSIHQTADGVESGFDFTNKNPNATELDENLTGTIPYGATGNFASAFGGKSAAMGKRSHAEGTTTIAKGAYSHAEGDNSVALGADSHAEGYKTTAAGEGSHTEGANTITEGDYSHAEGNNTKTDGNAAHAEGYSTEAGGVSDILGDVIGTISAAHAEGYSTQASGTGTHAEGYSTRSVASGAHAEGIYTGALDQGSHAEGINTEARGQASHVEGYNTAILDNKNYEGSVLAAHAEGYETNANNRGAHSEGVKTAASGESSHAEGNSSVAIGFASHAEGAGNIAHGESAHAEGNRTYAEGNFSHTEGNNTYAGINPSGEFFGESAHAEGENTHAYGYASHAEGIGTEAYGEAQHVQGRYNIDDPEGRYAHIVGNGFSNFEGEASNAHTLDWQGNAWFAGNVYVGGNNQDEGKKLLTADDLGTIGSEFDLVIETAEEFKKCVYMLHPNKNEDDSVDLTTKGEPNLDFNYRSILVRDVDFIASLGSSDLDLAVLQPSIRYIKFDNCQWHCQWWISGKEPTELQPNPSGTPTEYKPANGPLNVVLDGIYISEQNVIDSIPTEDDPDRYYYVGLRNFERIENCFIHYPSDYALVEELAEDGITPEYRYSFKFNLQYFNIIQNCKVTALWDGSNISGCRVSERIVRCNNCSNIFAEPIYRGGELYRVQMRESKNLSNIYGSPIIYTGCKAIDIDTCSEYDAPKTSEVDEFDLIITSVADMAALPSNTTAKNVLVTGFTLSNKTAVPGFFDNTVSESNEPYFVKFIVPKNVKYLKFSKSFYYTLARVVIQGHPDCIIDGLPTITAPYNYTQCTVLYDFKEVRNCYARGINTYGENNAIVENNLTVGISNVLMNAPNISTYPALASSYNYKKTRFINCDLSYIDHAESITNSRIITTNKIGVSPYIKNAETINGLKVYSIPTSQKFTLQNCSHVSNVNSNGYNIIYDSCSKIDAETCDNVPEELIKYATKELINDSIKDFVNTSKLKSSIEYDLIISSVDEFKALEFNTTAVNVLVQNFGIYRDNHVNGFFDNSASDYMYWTKFRIPANVKYIKFNNFKQQNSRVVIQGHEDCIIDGFPTVTSPYTATKLYGNGVILYNFKEVRNCHCTNVHQIDADGNYTFVPGVNGISNVILNMPYPTEEYSITISGEKVSIDTTNLAPDREEQNTKFVNCDLMFIKGASTIENCRVHMGKAMTDYVYKSYVPAISDANLINGLTLQYIASNSPLLVKNCKNVFGINDNSYAIDYIDCSNIGATQKYVDEAAANAGKIKEVVATSNSGLKVTTSEGVAAIGWDEEVIFVFDGGGLEEDFIEPPYSEGLAFTSNNDGTCSVSGIGTCADVNLVIPPISSAGDKVTSISNKAFSGCTSIVSVTIPDSVISIGDSVFSTCKSLKSITVNKNNPAYQSIDGNLYSKDGKTLIKYAIGKTSKTFIIPNFITMIGANAFYNGTNLTSVTIPDSVTSIGYYAFGYCNFLTAAISDSVTSISGWAFSYCKSLRTIIYNGTTEQWRNISFGLAWNQFVPATYVQCIDGTVAL